MKTNWPFVIVRLKLKFKAKPVVKFCKETGEKYVFVKGVANVRHMFHKNRKPYTITLKEFKEQQP